MSLSLFDFNLLVGTISTMFTATPQSLALLFMLAIGIVILNAFLLMISGILGMVLLKRMQISSLNLEQEKRQAHEKAEMLLEIARKESFRVVEEANKKAGELLDQTHVVKDSLEASFDKEVKEFSQQEKLRVTEISNQLVAVYHEMIDSTKQQYGTIVASIAKEMADETGRSLKQFEQSLKDQTTRYEGALKQQVQEGFMSAQKDISDYKRESLRKVEDAIFLILNLVAKSVFGKALSLEDQQDLVIHALNEAKQQAFFEI